MPFETPSTPVLLRPQDVSVVRKAPETVTEPPTTICDLPIEILLYIFTFNTQLNFDHIRNPSRTARRHTSRVYRQWQHLLLIVLFSASGTKVSTLMVWIRHTPHWHDYSSPMRTRKTFSTYWPCPTLYERYRNVTPALQSRYWAVLNL